MASELYLMEVGDGRYSILLCDDRSITQMPAMTPAESLTASIAAANLVLHSACVLPRTFLGCQDHISAAGGRSLQHWRVREGIP